MTGLASYQEDNTSILAKPNLDDLESSMNWITLCWWLSPVLYLWGVPSLTPASYLSPISTYLHYLKLNFKAGRGTFFGSRFTKMHRIKVTDRKPASKESPALTSTIKYQKILWRDCLPLCLELDSALWVQTKPEGSYVNTEISVLYTVGNKLLMWQWSHIFSGLLRELWESSKRCRRAL